MCEQGRERGGGPRRAWERGEKRGEIYSSLEVERNVAANHGACHITSVFKKSS